MKEIFDFQGKEITLGTIVKREKAAEDGKMESDYFVYERHQERNKNFLFIYDSNGKTNKDSFLNIVIDSATSLINSENGKWVLLGNKDEVYGKLFKR